jgi:hypothetical protein
MKRVRVHDECTRDPGEASYLVRRKTQLLALGPYVDELALAFIEGSAIGGRQRAVVKRREVVIKNGSGDRPEVTLRLRAVTTTSSSLSDDSLWSVAAAPGPGVVVWPQAEPLIATSAGTTAHTR